MSERRDFECYLTEIDGVEISIRVSGEKLAFEEFVITDRAGQLHRYRVLEDADNQPLGWRVQEMERGRKPTEADKRIREMELNAEWGSMKQRGVLYNAFERLLEMNTRGMNRKQRRAYRAQHPNPHKPPGAEHQE